MAKSQPKAEPTEKPPKMITGQASFDEVRRIGLLIRDHGVKIGLIPPPKDEPNVTY